MTPPSPLFWRWNIGKKNENIYTTASKYCSLLQYLTYNFPLSILKISRNLKKIIIILIGVPIRKLIIRMQTISPCLVKIPLNFLSAHKYTLIYSPQYNNTKPFHNSYANNISTVGKNSSQFSLGT